MVATLQGEGSWLERQCRPGACRAVVEGFLSPPTEQCGPWKALVWGHHHLRASVPFLSKSPSCEMPPKCPSLVSWMESCSWGRALFPGDQTHPVPGGLTNQAENCSLRGNYLSGLFVETLPAINSWQRSRAGRGPRSAPGGSVRGAGCAAEPVPGVSSTTPALFIRKLL